MPRLCKLRPIADKDLKNIYRYSTEKWGQVRADRYIIDIEKTFQNLAISNKQGRDCSHVRPNLRAFSVVSHVIFYKPTTYGIAVIRILHNSMDENRHI
jgi:toxin ParE1/3/4